MELKDFLIIDGILVGLLLLSSAVLAVLKLVGIIAWTWAEVCVPLMVLGIFAIGHLVILFIVLIYIFVASMMY